VREKPWYRKARAGWYLEVDGRQIRLTRGGQAETEREAWAEYHRVMAELGRGPDNRRARPSTAALILAFLTATSGRVKPSTAAWYARHLEPFEAAFGPRPAAELTPHEVATWLAGRPQADGTKHGTAAAIKRLTRWASRQKLLTGDPLEGLERPKMGRRSPAMRTDEADRLIAAVKYPDFRDVLVALRETGARPSEVAAVTAAHYRPEAGVWAFEEHKTDGSTGRPRVVYLTPEMVAMTERLAGARPRGPLFLNRRRRPWTRNAIGLAFGRLRDRLGLDRRYTPYSLRKGFGTDALARGVPAAIVAELMGHRSTAMLDRHYSHLSDRGSVLRAAAERARSAGPGPGKATP
jgi:integrase